MNYIVLILRNCKSAVIGTTGTLSDSGDVVELYISSVSLNLFCLKMTSVKRKIFKNQQHCHMGV